MIEEEWNRCCPKEESFHDDSIELRINAGVAELQLGNNKSMDIRKDASGKYVIPEIQDALIPAFEPTGFEDEKDTWYGYGILEWTEDRLGQYWVKGGS